MSLKQQLVYTGVLLVGLTILAIISISTDDSSFLSNQIQSLNEEQINKIGFEKKLANSDTKKKDTPTSNSKYNVSWAVDQVEQKFDYILGSSYATYYRVDSHIYTDKVIYRPNDVMFIEVYLNNAFNKSAIFTNLQDPNRVTYYLTIEILDPVGTKISSQFVEVQDSTAAVTYKLSQNASGGEYVINAVNYFSSTATKLVRVRNYPRDQLIIKTQFNLDSYRPGDTISGKLSVEQADGEDFSSDNEFTYSYSIDFQTSQIQQKGQPISSDGFAYFTIDIPSDTDILQATLAIVVTYGSIQQSYGATIIISQPDQSTFDFFVESGNLVQDVPNKIYFQAWATEDRADSLDFQQGQLIVLRKTDYPTFAPNEITVLTNISSVHKGKGSFIYTPTSDDEVMYLKVNLGGSATVKKEIQLKLTQQEIGFTVLNQNRVLANSDALQIKFFTNSLMNQNDTYVIAIKLKELEIFSDQLQFKPSTQQTYKIDAKQFPVVNGGILTVTLRKMTPVFYEEYQKYYTASQTQTKNSDTQLPDKNIISWFQYLGEITFFKKPSQTLKVSVKTDQAVYMPGDLVNYQVTVSSTNPSSFSDCFVSLTVTDDSVYQKLEERKQPPSLAARVYLENEILKTNESEFYFANQYIEHWFTPGLNNSNDYNLELLLGVQGWRYGVFDYQYFKANYDNHFSNLSDETKQQISVLYAYQLTYIAQSNNTMYEMAPQMAADGMVQKNAVVAQDRAQKAAVNVATEVEEEPTLNDYMVNIKNPRYWAHPLRKDWNASERIDLTETVLFFSANKTKSGVLKGSFRLSDLITKFRIIVNAFDQNGVIGYQQQSFQTQKPLYLTFDIPTSMTVGDIIKAQVNIVNLNTFDLKASLSLISQDPALTITLPTGLITVGAKKNQNAQITIQAKQISKLAQVQLGVSSSTTKGSFVDSLRLTTQVVAKGFPRQVNYGGYIGSQIFSTDQDTSASFSIDIPSTLETNSSSLQLKIFSSNYASLAEAVKQLIRDPYGCFEQTSSTTYPMVMGLTFLKALPNSQTDFEIQAMIADIEKKLKTGYDKLVSFKTKEKGYEWFGDSPAHEALSAYGLMQFTEMSQVTQIVDSGMVQDLKAWLLSRKNSKGGFQQNEKALDSFGRAPANITDAYIVWSLTSAGETDLDNEITALKKIADDSISGGNADAYFLGLLSASLYNLDRNQEAQVYADAIIKFALPTGNITRSLTTITTSDGSQRIVETTAISVIAWMNDQNRYSKYITNAVNWLVSQVKNGAYGSTQGTVLSLKAITTYMTNFASLNGKGSFVLKINSVEAQTISFTSDKKEAIEFDFAKILNDKKVADAFKVGSKVKFELSLQNFQINDGETKDFKISYAFTYQYSDTTPIAASSTLGFEVLQLFNSSTLGTDKQQGKTFTYNVIVKNLKTTGGQGMTVAILRIPSCLAMNFDLLESLKRNKQVAQYEIRNANTELVLYWRALAPGESKRVQISFIQRYAGTCVQKPHQAYYYYNNDEPAWVQAVFKTK